uniref:Reverse transcriptase zinc-binding domain-containing protein n=1 Tax=Hordeum vulgare subsp. vulgare TaxID=112509 RepID=A0A8I6YB20_HORVV
MPMFLLSFFEVPVGVRKRLDFYRSRFFWQSDEVKTKYRLARWDIICRPKDQGGLGIENLEVKNRCLLSKWLFKLSVESEGMWLQILKNKYLQQKTLAQVTVRPGDSPFWKGLMKTKTAFFNMTKFIIGNGESTRFWEDNWLGDEPLALQYPQLYNIAQRRQTIVAAVLRETPLNIQFRRSLIGNRWVRWLHLVRRLMDVSLSDDPDMIVWKLTSNDTFSVKSMYDHVIDSALIPKSSHIWNVKVPLKLKIFLWFVHKGVVLTKDNLAKRNWKGNRRCIFCETYETIKHLFLDCPMAKILWRSIHIAFNITPLLALTCYLGRGFTGLMSRSLS